MIKHLKPTYRTIITLLLSVVPLFSLAVDPIIPTSAKLKEQGDECYWAEKMSEALDKYTEALDQAKREVNDSMYNACLNCIGNIYLRVNDNKRALHYYTLGYEAAKSSKDVEMQYKFASNIVIASSSLGDVETAKKFFKLQTSLPVKNITNKHFYFLNNQALIAKAEGNLSMVEYHYKASLQYATESGMPTVYKMMPFIGLGDLELQRGEPQKALGYYTQARDSAEKARLNDPLKEVYKQMSEAYRRLGRHDSAARYKALYLAYSDSLFNANQFNMSSSKLLDYENAENKRHIDSLTSQNYVQTVVIGVFVVLVVALTLLYMALRRKTRNLLEAQRLLVSKNEDINHYDNQSRQLLQQYVSAMDSKHSQDPQPTQPSVPSSEEPKGIGLTNEQRNRLLEQIATIMDDVTVIACPDFNLSKLADMVGSNTKYVSWVINDAYNKSFKVLRNERRIHEACKRLSDREHYGNMTIQAIYEELGFNSASSFIQAFKNVCGMTPSVYQKLAEQKEREE